MKIIFLDIDGVLLTPDAIAAGRQKGGRPPKYCIDNLNRIVERTDARIVVSSSWRFLGIDRIRRRFKNWDIIGEVIDVTPELCEEHDGFFTAKTRGDEIAAWLNDNAGVEAFVVLDDDDDMGELMSHLVKTRFKDGLTSRKAEEAVKVLEGAK